MLDDFFVRGLLAAAGTACVAGPIGCIILWRRMAYFGETMAHSSLLGIALGVILGLDPGIGVFMTALAVAPILVFFQRVARLASDSLLGILSHSTLALGLVVLALSDSGQRHDLLGYLFGDVLAVTKADLLVIWGGGVLCLAVLAAIWHGLVAATLHADLAQAEGVPVLRHQILYVVLTAAIVAAGMKVIGILLIISLVILPAATARSLSHTPEQMAVMAAGIGILSAALGLLGSLWLDTPSGPSIVVAATLLFLVGLGVSGLVRAVR